MGQNRFLGRITFVLLVVTVCVAAGLLRIEQPVLLADDQDQAIAALTKALQAAESRAQAAEKAAAELQQENTGLRARIVYLSWEYVNTELKLRELKDLMLLYGLELELEGKNPLLEEVNKLRKIISQQEREIQVLYGYIVDSALKNAPVGNKVVPVYFYPKGEDPDPVVQKKIIDDMARVRSWYAKQLGGPTFHFVPPITMQGAHEKEWYENDGNGEGEFDAVRLHPEMLNILSTSSRTNCYIVFIDGAKYFRNWEKGEIIEGYSPDKCGILGGGGAVIGTARVQSQPALLAHELGHMFGLKDREPKTSWDGNLMNTKMAPTLEDNRFTNEELALLKQSSLIY